MMSAHPYAHLFARLSKQWATAKTTFHTESILQQTIDIQQIPAPTFHEERRADYVESQFRTYGFDSVERDTMGNVYGWLGDKNHQRVLVISAHLDTVFPEETNLKTHTDRNRVYGPGIGDNSLGVAALLILAQAMIPERNPQHYALCFVANTREEGLGNLDGIRVVVETITPQRIVAAIVLEGMALGRIYHGGIAVKRLRITSQAEGGHSWMSFGQPSAIHGLVNLAAEISHLEVPNQPRTTYNIGLIEGGRSVNTIATEAHFVIDMRSQSTQELQKLEKTVYRIGQQTS